MGMFDSVIIDKEVRDKYDIPNFSYQTKDLENLLENFYISKDMTLEREVIRYVEKDTKEEFNEKKTSPFTAIFDKYEVVREGRVKYDCFVGAVNFYTSYNKGEGHYWIEYCAFVENGVVFKIVKVEDKFLRNEQVEDDFEQHEEDLGGE